MTENNQGSFLTGFVSGMVAGAAGLFLFGTDDGKKIRQSLNKEWEQAKKTMAEEGVIENSSLSLREIIGSVFEKIGENLDEYQKTPSVSHAKKSSKTPSSNPKPKKTQKFKGV